MRYSTIRVPAGARVQITLGGRGGSKTRQPRDASGRFKAKPKRAQARDRKGRYKSR